MVLESLEGMLSRRGGSEQRYLSYSKRRFAGEMKRRKEVGKKRCPSSRHQERGKRGKKGKISDSSRSPKPCRFRGRKEKRKDEEGCRARKIKCIQGGGIGKAWGTSSYIFPSPSIVGALAAQNKTKKGEKKER